MIHVQRHTNKFRYNRVNRRKFLKIRFSMFALNIMKLTRVIHIYKSIVTAKNVIISLNFSCRRSYKKLLQIMCCGQKWQEQYFHLGYENFFFFLIVLHFSTFCDSYSVKTIYRAGAQHGVHTGLSHSHHIFTTVKFYLIKCAFLQYYHKHSSEKKWWECDSPDCL